MYTVYAISHDEGILDGLELFLGSFGLLVRTFNNVECFLDVELCSENGCIIIESNLPELNGLDLIKQLRESGKTLPILLLAASPSAEDSNQAINAGANVVLQKPFINNAVIKFIQHSYQLNTATKQLKSII